MNRLFLFSHYLRYLLFAHHDEGHGVHSPFIYNIIQNILEDERFFYAYDAIEDRRMVLMRDDRSILVKDLGAGNNNGKNIKVKNIAQRTAITHKYGQLLFKLVDSYAPNVIFELGTSLGISTMYLASARRQAKVFTFEGCPRTADIAKETFASLALSNIFLRVGNFEDQLPIALSKQERIDMAFIDGNHTYEATLRYFNWLLPKMHEGSVLVFDDIHWSKGMHRAWQQIKKHTGVVLTIDLFFVGLVFFRGGMAKQDIVIRY